MIQGEGIDATHIVLGNAQAGFLTVASSADVQLRGFSVDYRSPAHTQGVVVGVNPGANSFEVALESGYPALDSLMFSKDFFPGTFGMVFEPTAARLKATTKNFFMNLTFLPSGHGTWVVHLEPADRAIFQPTGRPAASRRETALRCPRGSRASSRSIEALT